MYPIISTHAGGLNHIATVFSELIENLEPVKLVNGKKHHPEHQLKRISYILDFIEVMDQLGVTVKTYP
ncbi:MAG: hypothetical protein H0U70_09700 [Tatlockia sp.]|nr:hypothetical protein [Tatlockia sp.]